MISLHLSALLKDINVNSLSEYRQEDVLQLAALIGFNKDESPEQALYKAIKLKMAFEEVKKEIEKLEAESLK